MHCDIFLPVQQDILLSGKCTERTTCVHCKEQFGTKFFLILMYENFLSAGILNGFPCVVHHSDDRLLKFD